MFFWNSCFFYDSSDVGNLISGSSAFAKSNLNRVAVKALGHLGPGCLSPTREERTGSSERSHGMTVPLHHGHLDHHLYLRWLVSWLSSRHSPLKRLVIFNSTLKKKFIWGQFCV